VRTSPVRRFGSQSMVLPLKRVLVRRPDRSFAVQDPARWHYKSTPLLDAAREEHDRFVSILRSAGVEVVHHDEPLPDHADSIYVHDPAIVTDAGAVILKMGKELRRGEEEAMARSFKKLDIPTHRVLRGDARAEGGDLLWLDHDTLAVGLGFRTNAEGLRQLKEALAVLEVELVPVQLPYGEGPESCLHLMSLISLVGERTAVVYPPLLPVEFWRCLVELGFELIEVPEEEFGTMGPNVLALSPERCVMLEGNPVTRRKLEQAGFEVETYCGNEISLKAEGGPTCLTRPILRSREE